MGYENTGKVWDIPSFKEFIATQDLSWAKKITLHHTATPSLAQRPHGWKAQHLRNLEHFYKNELKWSAGPHLFTDEDQAWGLSSLERRGVHARSFNADSIGIEVLGNYDNEDPKTGRGLKCWAFAALIVRALLSHMAPGVTINFHRDDPRTSKTCPGKLVNLPWFCDLVNQTSEPLNPRLLPSSPQDDRTDDEVISEAILAIEWQLEKIASAIE